MSGASLPATQADGRGRETLIRPFGRYGFRSGCCVISFGTRASVGRVAAEGSRFPLLDPVREAGARTDHASSHPVPAQPVVV
jgi:hypothetical protein